MHEHDRDDSTSESAGAVARGIVCPYCGHTQEPAPACSACSGCFDEWSLRATQDDMGAWFVRDTRRPHFVGVSYESMAASIRSGDIGMNSIVRGPTTRQFWTIARRAPGLAHLFGRCFSCQAPVREHAALCSACGASPPPVADRNFIGLPSVQRVAPPADARPDLSAFVDDSGILVVRVDPVVPAATAQLGQRLITQVAPTATSITVRAEVPAEPSASDPGASASERAYSAPMQRSLADRARRLERTNRLLLGLAAISFVIAVLVVLFTVGREEHHERRTRERVAEALRGVRQEFERKTPVVIPPQPDLPPMPDQPPAAGGASAGG
ncbi:MAG: hypothetical protein RL354_1336 [Planctomycetota bacterium]|jgi:hypothetical protein